MSSYRHILAAVDLSQDSAAVVARAKELAAKYDARLSLLHVVEFIPVDPAGEALLPPPVDLEGELLEGARERLDQLTREAGLAQAEQTVEVGSIKSGIVRVATEKEVDLIVLGTRERHGLALLLGSTERSLLHCAPCDILAVRLNGDAERTGGG